MSKIAFVSLFGVCLSAVALAKAESLGIGVTPSAIEIAESAEWPYTAPLFVTNYSSEQEIFEVTFTTNSNVSIDVNPGRFSLDSDRTKRVLVTFERPRKETSGEILVLSARASPEGLTTGTGIKIPFSAANPSHPSLRSDTQFLADIGKVVEAGVWSKWFSGAGMIFATLVLLWYLSDIVHLWVFNSNKQ